MKSLAIIDPRSPENIVKNLNREGFYTIYSPLCSVIDQPISGHPDIQMFIHNNNLFVHPDIDTEFLSKIENYINIVSCPTKLSRRYPADVPYNIACVGKIALHKKVITEKNIQEYFLRNGIEIINTNQGYSKCSTLIVDESGIITADISIHNAAQSAGIESLLISQGYIDLPGYKYGFIGGASGRYLNTIYLTGTIDHHPDCGRIVHFIESRGKTLKYLSNRVIFDAGSIFFI